MRSTNILRLAAPALLALAGATACDVAIATASTAAGSAYIVRAGSSAAAAAEVRTAGGRVVRPVGIINGVVATLTEAEAATLAGRSGVRVTPDHNLRVSDDATVATNSAPVAFDPLLPAPPTAAEIGANALHAAGLRTHRRA